MGIVCINRYSNNDSVVFPVNLFMCVLYQAKIKKTYLSMWKIGNCKLRYNSDMYVGVPFLRSWKEIIFYGLNEIL